MIVFLNILLLILICLIIYIIIDMAYKARLLDKVSRYIKIKNDKYYKDLIAYCNKRKKVSIKARFNLIYKIGILLDKAGIKSNLLINPTTIILLCIMCFFVCYIIVFNIFKIVLLSLIISIPAIFLPIVILNMISNYKSEQLEKVMLDFLLQLKNYTRINNDIIYAFKQVNTSDQLQGYIQTFLIQVNSGVKFENAMENLKEKIPFEKLKQVFSNIEYCYIYGGDFSELMDKSYKIISKVQKEKSKRIQDTKSARIVLGILIVLNLFIYFTYIENNAENYLLMTKKLAGMVILYWNFISIWILVFLMHKVKKLDY